MNRIKLNFCFILIPRELLIALKMSRIGFISDLQNFAKYGPSMKIKQAKVMIICTRKLLIFDISTWIIKPISAQSNKNPQSK